MDFKTQKLNFKAKVNSLMQQYERQKAEEEQKKQLIKKQIMNDIIKNRQKTQNQLNKQKSGINTKQYTSKTQITDRQSSQTPSVYLQNTFKDEKSKQNNVKRPSHTNSQFELDKKQQEFQNEARKQQKLQEITFNMKRRNKNSQDHINYQQFKYQQNNEQKQQNQKIDITVNKSQKNISKIRNNVIRKHQYNYPQVQQTFSDEDDQSRAPPSSSKFSKYFKDSAVDISRRSFCANNKKQQPKQEQNANKQIQQAENLQEIQKPEQRGVFLTMEQSESMTASDLPKNYAFQIKNDRSIDPQSIEQLKKLKIKEIQKKRQERIEQFRRNSSQKKVQMPKGRNSYSKKPERTQKDQTYDELPPRSGTIEKKNQKSIRSEKQITHRNTPIQPLVEPQQSQYNARPPNKPYANYSYNYEPTHRQPIPKQNNDYQDRQVKPLSPFKTPKTIQPQNKAKVTNKNTNIFVGDIQKQKSASKITNEPKIQPKDRKNSFTKQSNKKLMINAITYVCFPGELNRRQRQKLIDVLETSEYQFFIFLFKEYSRKIIKGIYILDSSQTRLQRIYGEKAPTQITAERVQEFYRFDSGSREFKKVDGCRSFSLSIHAIDMR